MNSDILTIIYVQELRYLNAKQQQKNGRISIFYGGQWGSILSICHISPGTGGVKGIWQLSLNLQVF